MKYAVVAFACAIAGGALALGFGSGLARVAQGAHFASHIVWSALVCWLVTLALYEGFLRRRVAPAISLIRNAISV